MGRQMRSKEKILEALKPQIELVFSLDRELNPDKYKDESRALVTLLYEYVLVKYRNNNTSFMQPNYEEYGLEIVQVGLRCIKNYKIDNEKGASFLTYFLDAWNTECSRIKRDEAIDGKPYIAEQDRRLVAKLDTYLKSKQLVLSATLHVELVSEVLGVSEKKAKEIINYYLIEIYKPPMEEEEEEERIIETVSGGISSPEEDTLAKANWHEAMMRIERSLNGKTLKPAVKDIITCDIAGIILDGYEDYPYDYSFVDLELMKKILYSKTIPPRSELALKNNVKDDTLDTQYSRVINEIRGKVKKKKKKGSLNGSQEEK